jgi:hypothetical protein
MKRTFGVVIFLLGLHTVVDGQSISEDYIFGIKGGVNYSNISGSITITNGGITSQLEPLLGYHFGLSCYSPTTDKLQYGAELQYTAQGAQGAGIKFEFNYVATAFVVKYNPFEFPLNLQIGPQFGYLVHGNAAGLDFSDELLKPDFTLTSGLGYKINRNFEMTARYNYGFSSVFPRLNDVDAFANRVLQFGLSYFF